MSGWSAFNKFHNIPDEEIIKNILILVRTVISYVLLNENPTLNSIYFDSKFTSKVKTNESRVAIDL